MNLVVQVICWWAAALVALLLFGLSGALLWVIWEELRVRRLHRLWTARDRSQAQEDMK